MVEIVETSFVVPSEETPKHSIWLSNIDHKNIMDYVPVVYVYRPIGGLDLHSTTGPLKQALAKALVHFYPLAGRLELDHDGRCEIACTGDGALFVVGRYDGNVDDFGDFKPSPEMRRLLVPSVESAEPPSAVLLMVQLTFFKCGGVTLGTAAHHHAVDGHSALHFVSTWADIACGIANDPPVKPHFDRSLLRARSLPTILFDHFDCKGINPNGLSMPQSPCVSTILKLSKSQVVRLKTCGSNNGKQLSTFLAVTALVWRSTCIARGLAAGHMTRLSTPVNFRSRLNPPLPPGFFGNAVCRTSTVADAGEIMSNSISFAAGIICDAIDKVNDEYVRSTIDYSELDRGRWKPSNMGGNLFVVSWLGMPTYFGDFGWGKPEFMGRASMLSNGCVYLMQSPEDDGGVYVPMTLESEVMEMFKKLFYKELEALNGDSV